MRVWEGFPTPPPAPGLQWNVLPPPSRGLWKGSFPHELPHTRTRKRSVLQPCRGPVGQEEGTGPLLQRGGWCHRSEDTAMKGPLPGPGRGRH